ncbi:hypothetical protein [Saccharopolyspora rectivirgula]|jgi:hypothetical protein|uniref:hypothetical protein n=1 Tax=Saccharopolyspora rectivirgula TaxID=28042 RepID=UPI0003F65DBE|nr:hypothetical protein [Saccharopolyspora rectivirgula]
MNPETPEADALEQAQEITETNEDLTPQNAEPPLDTNPADLLEQQQEVPEDDGYDY